MKKLFLLIMVLLCSVVSSAFEVAYVDMAKVFELYHKTKDADAALKKQKEIYTSYAERRKGELDSMVKSIIKLREEALNIAISPEQREIKYKEMESINAKIEAGQRELKAYGVEKSREMDAKFKSSQDKITDEIVNYISKHAKANKLDLVLDISGKTMNGISSIVYYSAEKDITNDVIKRLNIGHEKSDKK